MLTYVPRQWRDIDLFHMIGAEDWQSIFCDDSDI